MRGLPKAKTALAALALTAGLAGTARADVEYSWSGFYVGGHVGAGALITPVEVDVPVADVTILGDHGSEGLLIGALAGYNWQVSERFVAGVQGDFTFADMDSEFQTSGADFEPDFVASASLRAGYLVTPDSLLYAIGGYSYSEFDVDDLLGEAQEDEFDGFHAGAGFETRLTDRLTVRVEYRYTQFGTE